MSLYPAEKYQDSKNHSTLSDQVLNNSLDSAANCAISFAANQYCNQTDSKRIVD